jgi:hypothetical protein
MKLRVLTPLVALALSCWPSAARACTVCMGADDSQIGGAINAAIFLLLGCIGGVLGLLVAFAVCLMKRANAPLPPEAEFQQS